MVGGQGWPNLAEVFYDQTPDQTSFATSRCLLTQGIVFATMALSCLAKQRGYINAAVASNGQADCPKPLHCRI